MPKVRGVTSCQIARPAYLFLLLLSLRLARDVNTRSVLDIGGIRLMGETQLSEAFSADDSNQRLRFFEDCDIGHFAATIFWRKPFFLSFIRIAVPVTDAVNITTPFEGQPCP